MTNFIPYLAAAAAIGALAAPASAQYGQPYPYPQPYPQTYPQQYPQTYPGYPQGYGQNPIGQIIDQLLGNRYSVTERQAVSRCASAAMAQARNQYRGGYNQGYAYPQGYPGYPGYPQGFAAPMMRVTAITSVERRSNGLRVRGLLNSGAAVQPYGQAYGYQNQGYAALGDLTFRCNVDYRGYVTNVRVSRNAQYRRY